MTDRVPPFQQSKSRIEAIDVARGTALIAMAVYHFTWDLEFFGYAPPGMTGQGGWRLFARAIASSFLFLVGFSLFLAHARGIRWRSFWWRMLQVGAAAAAITLVTYLATPDAFIFFGILHHIAVASLIGLLFLRLPAPVIFAIAVVVVVLPSWWRSDIFTQPILSWVGLATVNPRSNDFVPLFPWFGAVLSGIAAAKFAVGSELTSWLAGKKAPDWTRPLQLAGQHSLAVYLLHQPILIGLLFAAAQIHPPQAEEPRIGFQRACEFQCADVEDARFCQVYCGCVMVEIDRDRRAEAIYAGQADADTSDWLRDVALQCSLSTESEMFGDDR